MRSGRHIVLADESGYLLQPLARRTWAPRGCTPTHDCWDRRDRASAISALSVSPRRKRLGLYFDLLDHNVLTADFERFVAGLRRRFPHGIILVLDRWSVHRAAARNLREQFGRWLHVEWLPPYAPELNPVEPVWSHSKYADLANLLPDDIDALAGGVIDSLADIATTPRLLRSFFQHAGLGL